MEVRRQIHNWNLSPKEAIELQKDLANQVVQRPLDRPVELIAGLDVAFDESTQQCFGVAVLWNVKENRVLEVSEAVQRISFPYVPGLLSFREVPVLLTVLEKLRGTPDVIVCDRQGIAHPRRFGLASHVGVLLGVPTIGCAKSRLVGDYENPADAVGAWSPLIDRGVVVGAVVRTRVGVKPVFISIGHLITLQDAIHTILSCTRGYRLPEPTRLADRLVREFKKRVVG